MSEYLGFEPSSNDQYYFVSYNSDDSERLTGLLTLLHNTGMPLWYDYGLNYGINNCKDSEKDKWRVQIGEKIEHCFGMILFITEKLFSKIDTYIRTEFDLAKKKYEKPIYIVLLQEIDAISDIPDSMYDWWLEITGYQCLNAYKYSDTGSLLREFYRMLGIPIDDDREKTISELLSEASSKRLPTIDNMKSKDRLSLFQASEMLIKLEDSYQSNPRHIQTFNEFYIARREPNYNICMIKDGQSGKGVSLSDLVLYFTFFEGLYRVVKNGVLKISDIDDCFSDRFFTFIHNPLVQEKELYLVPSTYVNIFELYGLWKQYHVCNMSSPRAINAFLENEIPDYYLDNKTYEQDFWPISQRSALEQRFHYVNLFKHSSFSGYTEFVFKRLFPRNLRDAIRLQNEIIKDLSEDELYVETTKPEYLESMLIDFCYGLYDGTKLIAVCIIVLNRETERNLIIGSEKEIQNIFGKDLRHVDCLTFDTIQVNKNYRGYGIQSFFLSVAENLASMLDAQCILASVSPRNIPSKNNLSKAGYSVITTKKLKKGVYHNKERDIMIKFIK